VSRDWGTSAHNLADTVRAAARRSPSRTAVLTTDGDAAGHWTWAELDAEVDRVAAGLSGLGLQAGDRVGLALGNVREFVSSYFGTLRAGLVAVPVNTAYTHDERSHLLGDSGARAVVGFGREAAALAALATELPALEHVVVTGDPRPAGAGTLLPFQELGRRDGAPAVADGAGGGEDPAVIVYTSGTSGRPKGAVLSHRALVANLEQAAAIEPPTVTADDVVLLVLPLFHIYGLNAGLGRVAFHGATAVLAERFDPADSLASLARHRVSVVVGAPPMYVAWSLLPDVGEAFATVRLAVSGAAPLSPAVLERMLAATGHFVFEGYGLTETAPAVTSTLMSEAAKPGSIGRPLPGVEVRLVDAEGRELGGGAHEGATAGDDVDEFDDAAAGGVGGGDVGEIAVRGANLFSGYWPDRSGGPDADGWWRTGDVAYADSSGDLYLVDRRHELILVSGFNVYPREVEEVLLRSPDIEEAAVIGIPHPYTGEAVKALVVRTEGSHLTAADVIDWAARSLARFKCPTTVEFVSELPHSATGKVSKGRLRELAEGTGT